MSEEEAQWLYLPPAAAEKLCDLAYASGVTLVSSPHVSWAKNSRVLLPLWLAEVYRRARALANHDIPEWAPQNTPRGRSAEAEVAMLAWMLERVPLATFEAVWRLSGRAGLNKLLADLDPLVDEANWLTPSKPGRTP